MLLSPIDGLTILVFLSGMAMVAFQVKLPIQLAVGSSPYSVAVGDLNNDGQPDIAVANPGHE